MNIKLSRIWAYILFGSILSACSGSTTDVGAPLRGVFVDSAVQGLDYAAGELSGTTDIDGAFEYSEGDTVTFSIGALVFPGVTAAPQLSPIDLAQGAASETDVIVNIARLIQSLDADGDTSNGILIPETAKNLATAIDFGVPSAQFAQNTDVINLIANSGSLTTSLIPTDAALEHLYDSLGIPNPTNTQIASLGGFWNSYADEDLILISETGDVTFYDFDTVNTCHSTRLGTLTQVQGTLYLLESEGESAQVVITRVDNTLNILLIGSFALETTLSTGDLVAC